MGSSHSGQLKIFMDDVHPTDFTNGYHGGAV